LKRRSRPLPRRTSAALASRRTPPPLPSTPSRPGSSAPRTGLIETSRVATQGQERTAVLLHEALTGLARRLDDIESKVADGGQPSMDAALRAVERIETQLAETSEAREEAQSSRIEAALRGFEERIASISDRVAVGAPRPIGQRGLEPEAEVRSAVDEIRTRQAELDERGDHSATGRSNDAVLSSLRGDIARLAGRLDTARSSDGMAAALAAIQDEIESLQDAICGLATRAEADGIERTMHSILAQLVEASTPTEIAALGATANGLRAEIRRVGENASRRTAGAAGARHRDSGRTDRERGGARGRSRAGRAPGNAARRAAPRGGRDGGPAARPLARVPNHRAERPYERSRPAARRVRRSRGRASTRWRASSTVSARFRARRRKTFAPRSNRRRS
jgi:hypothetical protein